MWVGAAAAVLTLLLVLGVGAAAYRAGQGDEVTRTVTDGEGQVVRVTEIDGARRGPGLGLVLVPALGIAVVVLLFSNARHRGHHGPCGPGACRYEPPADVAPGAPTTSEDGGRGQDDPGGG